MRYYRIFIIMLAALLLSGGYAYSEQNSCESTQSSQRSYSNPVIDIIGLADPHVLLYEGVYYLYPTGDGKGYDVFTSTDLVNWENQGKCFEDERGGVWAPDVFHDETGDGKFYLYYTVGPMEFKVIGVAVADSPLGPFEDKGVLIEHAIDAHMFRDDNGKYYLYYVKTDFFNRIRVQPMETPTTPSGKSKLVILPVKPWELRGGAIAEAPWMIKRNGLYYLMYSASVAFTPWYAIGYAVSKSPMGPFKKYSDNPIAKRGGGVFGPGHHCVVKGPDRGLWMIYHQKASEKIDRDRFIAIDPLWFDQEGVIHTRTTRGTEQGTP